MLLWNFQSDMEKNTRPAASKNIVHVNSTKAVTSMYSTFVILAYHIAAQMTCSYSISNIRTFTFLDAKQNSASPIPLQSKHMRFYTCSCRHSFENKLRKHKHVLSSIHTSKHIIFTYSQVKRHNAHHNIAKVWAWEPARMCLPTYLNACMNVLKSAGSVSRHSLFE